MTVGAHFWGWLNQDKEKAINEYFYPKSNHSYRIKLVRKDHSGKRLTYKQYLRSCWSKTAQFLLEIVIQLPIRLLKQWKIWD